MQVYKIIFKPFLDFISGLLALVLISPIFLIISAVLFISNSGHPFFVQIRPGKKGKLFRIIKFKTMNDRKDDSKILLPDEQRLTSIGKFIRKFSLDEIPQLINVIKGEMSIIGPRPLLMEYLNLYNDFQNRRMEVKPGITGLAQVKGRNLISWEERFKFDIYYVENVSFLLDMKILLLTIKKVLTSEGISSSSSVTMEKFTGNK